MASFVEIFIISVSLAMDALSVSIAGGISAKRSKTIDAFKVALFFGGFQALMPVIGWLVGTVLQSYVSAYGHWIAFFLLGGIGVNMIRISFQKREEEKKNIVKTNTLMLLAIATSIDALIVGITLHVLAVPFIIAILIIGTITFILCFFGYLFGNILGKFFGKRFEIIGGIALIGIGLKIVLEHI